MSEDAKRVAQDYTLTTQDGRVWHVDNPMYAGGLIRCMLREGRSAHPVRANPEH